MKNYDAFHFVLLGGGWKPATVMEVGIDVVVVIVAVVVVVFVDDSSSFAIAHGFKPSVLAIFSGTLVDVINLLLGWEDIVGDLDLDILLAEYLS